MAPVHVPHRFRPLIACLSALLAVGCARIDRSLVLGSDPPGARLYVDGTYVGLTPQRIPYVHPGRVVVRLEKEGYESVAAEVDIQTTHDARIGPDFFAENLTPGGVHTVASHTFPLSPLTAVSYTDDQLKELLRRAAEFRKAAQGEATPPGPAAAPAATPNALPPPAHVRGDAPPPPPASSAPPPPQAPSSPNR